MKAVQLLVQSTLPEDLQRPEYDVDARSLGDLLAEVARKHPDKFEAISKQLSDAGLRASYLQGETLGLEDLKPVIDKEKILVKMDGEIDQARKAAKDPEDFKRLQQEIWGRYADELESATMKAALAQGNALGYSVASGARGKPAQLKMMLSTPGLYTDANDNVIPLFVRNSFGQGLRPHEYLAGTYGARKSVLATKRATAKGGFLAKQMVQASSPMLVTEDDCGSSNGVDLDIHDRSLKNRVLARETKGLPAGTVLDRAAITDLKKRGVENLIVRSALTCETGNGICKKCVGKDAEGKFPPIGEAVGITAAQAIGEPITQGALNTKHTGGVGGGAKREYSGFDWINQFLQTPSQFKDRAMVAEKAGRVERIEEAPQGGTYVTVAGERYYVAPGFELEVEEGQEVEAGEQLSAGLVNPSDVVRLRGLGEGRRYFSDRLKQMLDDSGMDADRRTTEMLARSAINHIKIDELDDPAGYLPDDVVSYNRYLSEYTPAKDTQPMLPGKAVGKVLQAPALHYAIGTRITPSIAKRLEKAEWGDIQVSEQAPRFSPQMVRLQSASHNNPDWLAQQHTSYLKRQLSDSAARGLDTNIEKNVHFAPRLAVGEDFGKDIRETGTF